MIKTSTKFRALLNRPGMLLRPCAYDALSAKLIEQAGFKVIGTSGYAISASRIGEPDIGLLGFDGMLSQCRNIIESVPGTPVDIDADTGYGNEVNVFYTTEKFIRAGAAGLRIEDQTWPKRCGHMEGKKIIDVEEMVLKIKAAKFAVEMSDSPDFVIGARTDSRALKSIDDVIRRANEYIFAGADYVYVECPESEDEIKELVRKIYGPVAMNIIPGGKSTVYPIKTYEKLGVKYLSVPMVCLYSATKAMRNALIALKDESLFTVDMLSVSWKEFNDLIGTPEWDVIKELI